MGFLVGGGAATEVTVIPAGDIAAEDVQAALDELDAEKVALADLASVVDGLGASLAGVADTGGDYAGTDVEAVLAEIAPQLGVGTDADAIHDNVAGEIAAVALKAVPAGADPVLIEDSAAADVKKRTTAQGIADLAPAPTHAATTGQTPDDHHSQVHDLAGADHNDATLAQLNVKVSDATLDDSGASRPPSGAAGGSLGGTYPNPTVDDGADGTAVHDNVAAEISAVAEKAVPVAADVLLIEDSAAANAKKRVQIGSLPSGGSGASPYALLRDEKTSGTQGGTFTSGAWRTRDLNTEVVDEIGITLASNQFTLPAGTYRFSASCPAFEVGRHKSRLQNISDGTTVLLGESSWANIPVASLPVTYSRLEGQFTLAASKTLELQHQCSDTKSTNGFGINAIFGNEVYASIELVKVA